MMRITVNLKDGGVRLTFGDVPVDSAFVDRDGDFCIKVYDDETVKNTFIRPKNGRAHIYQFENSEPIQRIIHNIEIREVE